uniref:Uncharacterized protein n=1 Tax=Glossina austeni TaxID=7395 RepID=A0A1A9VLX2_GLOAU
MNAPSGHLPEEVEKSDFECKTIARLIIALADILQSSRGRVVKASDSKSDSLWERRFESYRLRLRQSFSVVCNSFLFICKEAYQLYHPLLKLLDVRVQIYALHTNVDILTTIYVKMVMWSANTCIGMYIKSDLTQSNNSNNNNNNKNNERQFAVFTRYTLLPKKKMLTESPTNALIEAFAKV